MSETPTGSSEAFFEGEEPSMEDILASIRKIIAEDKSQNIETAPEIEPELEHSFLDREVFEDDEDNTEEAIEQDVTNLTDLVADNLLAENSETNADSEPGEVEVMNFDENLDLVLNDDASDFLTMRDPVPQNTEIENGQSEQETSQRANDDIEQLESIFAGFDDMQEEDISSADADEEILETPSEDRNNEDPAFLDEDEDLTLLDEDEDMADEFLVKATPDDDIDLVKSLLADLMEDSEADTDVETQIDDGVSELAQDITDDAEKAKEGELDGAAFLQETEDEQSDSVLDDLLSGSLEAEERASESDFEEDLRIPPIEDDDNDVDTDFEMENELASIARRASEAASGEQEDFASEDAADIVDLSLPDIAAKFALNASDEVSTLPDMLAQEDESPAEAVEDEDDIESLMAIMGEDVASDPDVEMQDLAAPEMPAQPDPQGAAHPVDEQEEDPMVRIVKTDTLTNEETDKSTSEAFASLSSVVREKTEAEESGPPIGDLVQLALKPMLQEWLDKNLKTIVERAVAKEVKRIASGK